MDQTYTTTQIMKHLGVGSFSPDLLIAKGVDPAEKKKNGYSWHARDVEKIAKVISDVVTERAGFTVVEPRATSKKAKAAEPDPLNDDDDDDSL